MTTSFISRVSLPSLPPLLAITQRHAVHALLYLIVSLLAVAADFFALGAPFVAALEVIIYAGAIMVLFVFVVMMLNLAEHAMEVGKRVAEAARLARSAVLSFILLGELVYCTSTARHLTIARQFSEPQAGWHGAVRDLCDRRRTRILVADGGPGRGISSGASCISQRGGGNMPPVPMQHALMLAAILFMLGLTGFSRGVTSSSRSCRLRSCSMPVVWPLSRRARVGHSRMVR